MITTIALLLIGVITGNAFSRVYAQSRIDQSNQPTCDSGQYYDTDRKRCVDDRPDCGQGQHYDKAKGECVDDERNCDSGQHYDKSKRDCLVDRKRAGNDNCSESQKLDNGFCCPQGFHPGYELNPDRKKCA
jgi:hypothetical protein